MSKEKFKFNTKTLKFEKVELSLLDKLKRLGIHLGFSVVLSLIIILIAYPIVFEFINRQQVAENRKLKREYKEMNEKIETLVTDLEVLRMRDDSVYSEIFGMKPVAKSMLAGGTGGSDRFDYLKGYDNSELMLQSAKSLAELEAKMEVHKGRFEKVNKLSKARLKKLSNIPAIQPIYNQNLARTGSGFGMRLHPVYGVTRMHTGIDFVAKIGTKIYATGDGVVKNVYRERGGYGIHVVISHGFGYETLYAHLSRYTVKPGQRISRGEIIGTVGNTGTSTGPHLHYEVIKNGKKINPSSFFFNDLTYGQYREMVRIASEESTSLD